MNGEAVDRQAPQLESLAFSSTTLDRSAGDGTITITAHITDDLSGFATPPADAPLGYNKAFACFYGPNGVGNQVDVGVQHDCVPFVAGNRVSGTARDGVYRVALTIPRFSDTGTWTLYQVDLYDTVSNYHTYYAADLEAAGFITQVTVT